MKLRPYQEQGQSDILEGFKDSKRLMFQLATGGGKTVIFVNIIKHFLKKGKRVMLVAHRQELIDQAWATLYKNKIYSGIIKASQPTNYELPCQVASIQTLARRDNLPDADLIIFDESHHCQHDNTYGDVISAHYPDSLVLGVTATPYRLSGHGFRKFFDKLIVSANYSDLRDEGYLVPYKYLIGGFPDMDNIKLSNGDYLAKDSEKAMSLAPIVESYLEHANGKKGIVFAVNVNHSITICNKYKTAGIAAEHVDGTTPDEERSGIFARFKTGETKIIVNVGIATEGTDLPDADFVQLARPTKSLSMYLQMVGRAFRVLSGVVDNLYTPEARRSAILASEKPNALILDNSGCWEDHGMPDQDFNWQWYFKGISRKEKGEAVEFIELIEFVAEDEGGKIVRTKNPEEIDGMRLIEVNKQMRQRVLNVTSIKEFDKLMVTHSRIKNIKKKGWTTFFKFQTDCKKKFIDMGDEVWAYIIKRLYTEPHEESEKIKLYLKNTKAGIIEGYRNNPTEMDFLILGLENQCRKRMDNAMQWYVPISALKKQRAEYDKFKTKEPKLTAKL